jgi:hypothetical protein
MVEREPRPENTAALVVVLAVMAIAAGALFWQLNRQTSSPEAAGAGPLGHNPAAGVAPAQTRQLP